MTDDLNNVDLIVTRMSDSRMTSFTAILVSKAERVFLATVPFI